MSQLLKSSKRYKKLLGTWGEEFLDEWMKGKRWVVFKKNQKIWRGEIDRVYKYLYLKNKMGFCIAEIKTLCCLTRERFFSFFTEVGLESLVKRKQILNLYRYAEYLNKKKFKSFFIKNIHIRFFIVLKMYDDYENENFFRSQKSYTVCLQTKKNLILSFTPELKY